MGKTIKSKVQNSHFGDYDDERKIICITEDY